MNVFTTDHPITSVRPLLNQWQRRSLALLFLAYPAYLLLLGPFAALDSRNCLNFVPECLRGAIYCPANPVVCLLGDDDEDSNDNLYLAYLGMWCPADGIR